MAGIAKDSSFLPAVTLDLGCRREGWRKDLQPSCSLLVTVKDPVYTLCSCATILQVLSPNDSLLSCSRHDPSSDNQSPNKYFSGHSKLEVPSTAGQRRHMCT